MIYSQVWGQSSCSLWTDTWKLWNTMSTSASTYCVSFLWKILCFTGTPFMNSAVSAQTFSPWTDHHSSSQKRLLLNQTKLNSDIASPYTQAVDLLKQSAKEGAPTAKSRSPTSHWHATATHGHPRRLTLGRSVSDNTAQRASARESTRFPPELRTKTSTCTWAELWLRDCPRSKRFYLTSLLQHLSSFAIDNAQQKGVVLQLFLKYVWGVCLKLGASLRFHFSD